LLSELLTTECIRIPLSSQSKADLLRELVRLALADSSEESVCAVLDAVEEREFQVSTAMGGGLAVPHARTDLVPSLRLSAGLVRGVRDYAAPDGSLVQVAFLVLTPLAASTAHVRVLASLARLHHRALSREAMLAACSPEEFLDVIRRSDREAGVLVT